MMTPILRHRDDLREADRAAAWDTLRPKYSLEGPAVDISDETTDDGSTETGG